MKQRITMQNKQKNQHLKTGKDAEQLACEFLQQNGLLLICRNYCCRLGEIDLIMQDDETLVMVEVRYRNSDKYGSALESVTRKKQQRIISAAQTYLSEEKIYNSPIRFDVIAISGNNPLQWITNAFQTTY